MRVVSLVPSWTETLIEANVDVVGRTRYCIHPEAKVKGITVVGGTKRVDWQLVASLKPDIVVFDKEENTKEMFDECSLPKIFTHVESVFSMPAEFKKIGEKLESDELLSMSIKWAELNLKLKKRVADVCTESGLNEFFNYVEFWKKPRNNQQIKKIVYLIWKDPWMTVGQKTFIASVLSLLGLGRYLLEFSETDSRYPEIDLNKINKDFKSEELLLLFSSEPYPFGGDWNKKKSYFKDLKNPMALIDGEKFSWFGIRSYRFLSQL